MPHHAVERDELMSCALVGLCEARARFNAERGVPLGAYARLRIRGALVDGMRNSIGLVRRRYFESFKQQQQNAHQSQSLQQHLQSLKREIMRNYAQGASTGCPEQLLADKESASRLHAAMSLLEPEKRALIRRLFGLDGVDESGEDLAQSLGCHRSSILRRKRKILAELHVLLREEQTACGPSVRKSPRRARPNMLHAFRERASLADVSPRSRAKRKTVASSEAHGKMPRSL